MRLHSRDTMRPSFAKSFASKMRAQETPGARCTRSLAWSVENTRVNHHRFTGTPGISCAMVLTVSFVLSPVTGLCCHRRLRDNSRKLDASVGASGPHDFAVRVSAARQSRAFASTASTPDVRDDRETPLFRVGQPTHDDDLRRKNSGKFLRAGLDRFLLICPSGKSGWCTRSLEVNSPWSIS